MKAGRHYLVIASVPRPGRWGLCGRILYLGVTERDFLQAQGDARSIRNVSIPAMRGVIYDRLGEPLADQHAGVRGLDRSQAAPVSAARRSG